MSGAEIITRGWGEFRLGDVEALALELLQQELALEVNKRH